MMKFLSHTLALTLLLQAVYCQLRSSNTGPPKQNSQNGLNVLRFNNNKYNKHDTFFDEIQGSLTNTLDNLGASNNYDGSKPSELERLLNILKNIDELKMDLDYFKELIEKRILFEKERQEMDHEINDILSTISNRRKPKNYNRGNNYEFY